MLDRIAWFKLAVGNNQTMHHEWFCDFTTCANQTASTHFKNAATTNVVLNGNVCRQRWCRMSLPPPPPPSYHHILNAIKTPIRWLECNRMTWLIIRII